MAIEPGSASDAQKRIRDNRVDYPRARGDGTVTAPGERRLPSAGASLFDASVSPDRKSVV